MLDSQRIIEWVEAKGKYCPYCKVEGDFDGDTPEFDGYKIIAPTECLTCGKKWKEVYTLVGIQEE